jgi:hypothetical protein
MAKKAKSSSGKKLAANVKIGLVTSAKFTNTTLEKKFWKGLRTTGWEADPSKPDGVNGRVMIDAREALGDYDDKDIKQTLNGYVKALNADTNVRVIVSAGGLVAAFAAQKKSTNKPYVIIIGQIPANNDFDLDPDSNQLFCGGVNLDSTGANAKRHAALVKKHNLRPKEVCLIVNSNARMSKAEIHAWKNHGWKQTKIDENDVAEFPLALDRAKNLKNAKAVVISADPFFASKRDDLVLAVNNTTLKVCYPFKYYKDATQPPKTGDSMWLGPDLEGAYETVGEKVGTILIELVANRPAPFVELDTADILGPVNL